MLFIVLGVTVIAMLAALGQMFLYEQGTYRQRVQEEVDTLSLLYADVLPASLDFNDPAAAEAYISSLRFQSQIRQACVYDESGNLFAAFSADGTSSGCDPLPAPDAFRTFHGLTYLSFAPIEREGELVGYFHIRYQIQPFYQRMLQYGFSFFILALSLILVAGLMWFGLRRYVTRPVIELAQTAQGISETEDYGVRADKASNDEIGNLADAFNTLLATTEESIRLRDDFLSIASHELRTPLTPIRLQLQLIRMSLSPEEADYAKLREKLIRVSDLALKELDRFTRLVESLLDVTRLTSGRFELAPEAVDLREMMDELVERKRSEAAKVESELRLRIEDELEIQADRLRLEQAVLNLMSNALKYGARHPVDLTVSRDGDCARIAVRDRGIGISADDSGRIFNRFERAASLQSFGGLGLGLYIANQIVEAHHGRILVESRPGKGSTFTIEIPLA